MTVEQFKAHLLAKIAKLRAGDEAEQEGAAEVQFVVDYIDGKNPMVSSLQEACDYMAEINLCAEIGK